jgi:hypothetical protein
MQSVVGLINNKRATLYETQQFPYQLIFLVLAPCSAVLVVCPGDLRHAINNNIVAQTPSSP